MPNRAGHSDVSLSLCIAITTLRHFTSLTFAEIERKLGIPASTCSDIYQKALKQAGNDDFNCLISTFDKSSHPGAKPKVPNGSEISAQIRAEIINQPYEKTHIAGRKVLQDIDPNIQLSRTTFERIAHNHRDPDHQYEIVRRSRPKKLPLSDENMTQRYNHCTWMVEAIYNDVIFVCCDEFQVKWGGPERKKQKMSLPKGADATEFPIRDTAVRFSQMIWAAITSDNLDSDALIERPVYIWEPETKDQMTERTRKLEMVNCQGQQELSEALKRAEQEGTKEFDHLRDLNAKIISDNNKLRQQYPGIRKGIKRQKKAHQIWKETKFKRGNYKGGMDFIAYSEICLQYLFPYYQAVQKAYPNREVWLVQDNAGLHTKA